MRHRAVPDRGNAKLHTADALTSTHRAIMASDFIWNGEGDGRKVSVELASTFGFRWRLWLLVDGKAIANDIAGSTPLTAVVAGSESPATVRVNLETRPSLLRSSTEKLIAVDWNDRRIAMKTVVAPWANTIPVWIRALLFYGLLAAFLLGGDGTPRWLRLSVASAFFLSVVAGNLPRRFTGSEAQPS